MRKLLLILLLVSSVAQAQMIPPLYGIIKPTNGRAWQYSRTVTIDHTKVLADWTGYTVLFYGTYSYLATVANGGNVQSSTGTDIAFFTDATYVTLLKFTKILYNATTGEVEYKIKLDASASIDKTFEIAYGNAAQVTSLQDVANTFPASLKLYAPFPDGTTLDVNDYSNNGNNGTNVGSSTAITGKVDGGVGFNGTTQDVSFGNPSGLQITGNLTISAWIKITSQPGAGGAYQIVAKDNNTGGRAYTMDMLRNGGGTTTHARIYINGSAGGIIEGTTNLSASTWYHIVGVYNTAGTLDIYVNGASDATQITGGSSSIPSATANVKVGARDYSGFENFFNGNEDEVQIWNISLTANQVGTLDNNESSPSTFYSISTAH